MGKSKCIPDDCLPKGAVYPENVRMIMIPEFHIPWDDTEYMSAQRSAWFSEDKDTLSRFCQRYSRICMPATKKGMKTFVNKLQDDIIDLNDGTFGIVKNSYGIEFSEDNIPLAIEAYCNDKKFTGLKNEVIAIFFTYKTLLS